MDLNVAARLRIMPDNVDVDLEGVKGKVGELAGEYGKLDSAEVKPIAFGLTAIEATVLLADDQGGLDQLEEKIKKIEGVADVELLEAGRL